MPPYTSIKSGAHKIQDAIDQTIAGDTVRIVSGIYHPDTTIFLRDSIVVIGAGRDLTIIAPNRDDILNIFQLTGPLEATGGGLTLTGCMIGGYESPKYDTPQQNGILIHRKRTTTNRILDNTFFYCNNALHLGYVDVEVAGNYFDSNITAVQISFGGPFDIHHNTITGWPVGGGQPRSFGVSSHGWPVLGPTRVHHNVAFLHRGNGYGATNVGDSVVVFNNLIVTGGSYAMFNYCNCNGAVFKNNTVVRTMTDDNSWIASFTAEQGAEVVLENNVFSGLDGPVRLIDYYPGGRMRFAYNALWGLTAGTGGVPGLAISPTLVLDTIGNLYHDPMFTGDSTYRLQRGSPLIDTGSPELTDPDGTRSAIV